MNLTDQEKRIKVTEACGWTTIHKGTHYDTEHKVYGEPPATFAMRVPANRGHACTELPDYANDLNAMHETEKVLTDDQTDSYRKTLMDSMIKHGGPCGYSDAISATAAQRFDAFGKTLNLW